MSIGRPLTNSVRTSFYSTITSRGFIYTHSFDVVKLKFHGTDTDTDTDTDFRDAPIV